MTTALLDLVRKRAGNACEYCRLPQRVRDLKYQVDHVIARQHGGLTQADNLALACPRCNLHKGPNLASIDPASGAIVRLFNPRTDRWIDHFGWIGTRVEPLTPVGRATARALPLNHPNNIAYREELVSAGEFPPPD